MPNVVIQNTDIFNILYIFNKLCFFFNILIRTYLKGPQKIASIFKLWTNGEYFMNQILSTNDIGAT